MKTIEIRTTQNVTIEYELAGLKERIIAYFIDVMIVYVVFFFLLMFISTTVGSLFSDSDFLLGIVIGLGPIIGLIAYQLFSEVTFNGQSWGKKAMSIKVVRLDGREAGLSDYLLRSIFYIIDTIFSFGILAAILISSSEKKQRLGDMTANTTVIKVKSEVEFRLKDILNIQSIKDYEPQYLAVRQLSEQDMLLIKNVISRYQKYKNQAHAEVVLEVVEKLKNRLELEQLPKNKIEFLKTLIRDYIVLTR